MKIGRVWIQKASFSQWEGRLVGECRRWYASAPWVHGSLTSPALWRVEPTIEGHDWGWYVGWLWNWMRVETGTKEEWDPDAVAQA
jgi:hypothetical protein